MLFLNFFVSVNRFSTSKLPPILLFTTSFYTHCLSSITRHFINILPKFLFSHNLFIVTLYRHYSLLSALAARVVDAQMPESQFTLAEQSELFTFDEGGASSVNKAIEILNTGTKDDVLIQLVQQFESIFVSIEDQGSLLEDKIDEHLNADEEIAAQAEYDREVNPPPPPPPSASASASTMINSTTSDAAYLQHVSNFFLNPHSFSISSFNTHRSFMSCSFSLILILVCVCSYQYYT